MEACFSSCDRCRQEGKVLRCDFVAYTSLLLAMTENRKRGYFCGPCALKISDETLTHTASKGWLDLWFVFYLPASWSVRVLVRRRVRALQRIAVEQLQGAARRDFSRIRFPHPAFMGFYLLLLFSWAAWSLWGPVSAILRN